MSIPRAPGWAVDQIDHMMENDFLRNNRSGMIVGGLVGATMGVVGAGVAATAAATSLGPAAAAAVAELGALDVAVAAPVLAAPTVAAGGVAIADIARRVGQRARKAGVTAVATNVAAGVMVGGGWVGAYIGAGAQAGGRWVWKRLRIEDGSDSSPGL